MKRTLLTCNHAVLLLCASMYLGTGWSIVFFTYPVVPQLTPANYYLQLVPPLQAAVPFFTYMTYVMITLGLVMVVSEWRTRLRWVPIAYLVLTIAAGLYTQQMIFPVNDEMAKGIADPARLQVVLEQWKSLHLTRVSMWTLEWACMMFWFGYWATKGRRAI